MIYTIRTTSGREDIVVDLLISKVEQDSIDIKSVFHPAEIKGYVFVEGSLTAVHKAMMGLMHSRGLIDKAVPLQQISHFLEAKKTRMLIDEGDVVEIIGGPFKGEKGRVKRVNKIKDEVTAELLEASIPIPVTIATEFVKVVKKAANAAPAREEEEAPREERETSVFDREELAKIEREDAKKAPPEEEQEEQAEKKDMIAQLKEEEQEKAKEEAAAPPAETAPDEPAAAPDLLNELEKEKHKKKSPQELEEEDV
ncbi:MAG: transcription elongation factor Spt5 [Candidatus Aenigmarchaeota archaeon]|nr:transcription elongation factor Spt5 [Candidatus Aenigmarchaeota archaeon]